VRAASVARFLPRPLRSLLAKGAASSNGPAATPDASRKAIAAVRDPDALPHAYFFTRLLFPPDALPSIALQNDVWEKSASRLWLSESAARARGMDGFTAVSWLEIRSYMLNTLLRDTDAMSMCHSLEVRVPFLDAPLVDYVLSLPEKAKRPTPRPKSLLIEALGDVFTKEILAQRKHTFTFPWENWLRGGLGKRVAAGLADWSPMLEPHLGQDFAQQVWGDFLAGRTTWSRPWSLYVLNEWVKHHAAMSSAPSVDHAKPAVVAIS